MDSLRLFDTVFRPLIARALSFFASSLFKLKIKVETRTSLLKYDFSLSFSLFGINLKMIQINRIIPHRESRDILKALRYIIRGLMLMTAGIECSKIYLYNVK